MVFLEGRITEKTQTIVDGSVEEDEPYLSALTCMRCWECARNGHRYHDTNDNPSSALN